MIEQRLFIMTAAEGSYADYFYHAKNCLREASTDYKKDPGRYLRAVHFLTVATAMVYARPVPYHRKFQEMLTFVKSFMTKERLAIVRRAAEDTYVAKSARVIGDNCMTAEEFAVYEETVYTFMLRETRYESREIQRDINTRYYVAKHEILSLFAEEEQKKKKAEKERETRMAQTDSVRGPEMPKPDGSNPYAIAKYLKQYVVGQDEAVDTLSNLVFQYMCYVKKKERPPKNYNILLIGASGSGKTTMINALSRVFPVKKMDATGVTETGYRGRDADDLVKNMKYGNIVFFDEFDKLLMPSVDSSGTDTHKEVQSRFFTAMEDPENRSFNIFCGAFEGIVDIAKKRLRKNNSFIGFGGGVARPAARMGTVVTARGNADGVLAAGTGGGLAVSQGESILDITEDDLLKFGASREFTGRVDMIIKLRELTAQEYVRILKESRISPMKAEIQIAKDCYGIDLEVTDACYLEIAELAAGQEIGARALKQHLNHCIDPLLAQAMEEGQKELRLETISPHIEVFKNEGKSKP